jgi:hypothetical protein
VEVECFHHLMQIRQSVAFVLVLLVDLAQTLMRHQLDSVLRGQWNLNVAKLTQAAILLV